MVRRYPQNVPQGRRVFPSLTVHEHLAMVARHEGAWTIARVYEAFPRLAERRGHGGAELSGGEQQMLAVARALLLNPALLVTDKPTEGLAPVLVEQNIAVAASIAQQAMVMVGGRIALVADAATLATDVALQRQYLGVGTSLIEEDAA